MFQNFNLRRELTGAFLVAMLAGCGRSALNAPSAPIGAVPQSPAYQPSGRSWMDPTASGRDLLYVSSITDYPAGDVYVYTYPQGHLVGTLTGFTSPLGECVDSAGDVFIVTLADQSGSSGIIYEYAHGGTRPIATLADPAGGDGCAIDPKSGDLAVANSADSNNPYGHYGDVAVYVHAEGKPKMYYGSGFVFGLCGYDSKENLYLSASNGQYFDQDEFVRLPAGSSQFQQISLNAKIYNWGGPPSVQWDGKYMTVSSAVERKPVYLYRLRISGDSATVASAATLSSKKNVLKSGQIWIQANRVLGADYVRGKGGVDSWSYPNAGKPRTAVKNRENVEPFGIAVSPVASQ